jgi:hypothetical protein
VTPATIPLPDPLALPGPPGLLAGLLHATLLVHLVAMNLLLGGGILGLKWRLFGSPEDAPHRREALALYVRAAPWLMAATVSLGVAPLLFLQVLHGTLFFTSAILMGGPWLAVIPLLTLAYLGIDLLALRIPPTSPAAKVIAVAVVSLLVVVAYVYTSNMSLMIRPEAFLDRYRADPRGLLPPTDVALIPRFLHSLLSAVAVAAVALALVGAGRRALSPQASAWALGRGLTWFFSATTLNLGVGLWFLLALPRSTLQRLAGVHPWATTLLATTIVLSLGLLGMAALSLKSTSPERSARHLAVLLALMLVVMVLLRDQVRGAAVASAGLLGEERCAAQWGPMAVFAVTLGLGLATVAWMLRALLRSD